MDKTGLILAVLLVQISSFAVRSESLEDVLSSIYKNYLSLGAFNSTSEGCFNSYMALPDLTKLKMLDASGKIPDGLLNGNLYALGTFDECYNLIENATGTDIYGKYCVGTLALPTAPTSRDEGKLKMMGINSDVGLHIATCLPSACTIEDFQKLLPFLSYSDRFCYTQAEPKELEAGDITAIVVLSIFAIILVLSTAFDIYLYYQERKPPHELYVAFSIWSNGRKILKTTSNPGQLSCLNGIKALSMVWVVYGHEHSNMLVYQGTNSILDIMDFMKAKKNMYVTSAPVSVDTFFAVAGILTVYALLNSLDKGKKYNVPMSYVHRYLRLTPPFAILIMVNATLLRFLGNGPFSGIVSDSVDPCKKYWWSALLYIQNYVNPDEMCTEHSWYLSVDMQLFVLSPIVLIILMKNPKAGVATIVMLIAGGIIAPFVATYENDLPAGIGGNSDMQVTLRYMKLYYFQTYTRYGPYVIGMLFGYIIYNLRAKKDSIRVPRNGFIVCLFWVLTMTGLVACLYGGAAVVVGEDDSLLARSFYNAFNRNAWSLCVCVVVLLCSLDLGGPINAFLSLPIFQLLARVSYCMYLVHYHLVVGNRMMNSKQVQYFSERTVINNFWSDFMITLIVAFFWSATFESPVIIIEKYLFGAPKKSQTSEKSEKPKETA